MLCPLFMYGQKWETINYEADELLGTKDSYVAYKYVKDKCAFVMWSHENKNFRISAQKRIFDASGRGATGYGIFDALVGFYDSDNKLLSKIDKFVFEVDDTDEMNNAHPNKYTRMGGNNLNKAWQILDYLRNKTGYVRIVTSIYGGDSFDLKIPCLKNEEQAPDDTNVSEE